MAMGKTRAWLTAVGVCPPGGLTVIPLEDCRRILAVDSKMTDEQVIDLRDQLYAIARLIFATRDPQYERTEIAQ